MIILLKAVAIVGAFILSLVTALILLSDDKKGAAGLFLTGVGLGLGAAVFAESTSGASKK